MPKLDITDNKIRARQRNPDEFDEDSFKTISLTSGVKAVVGVPRDSDSTEIQSVLFDNSKFNEASATQWLESHMTKFADALELENQKMGLFDDGENSAYEFIDVTEALEELNARIDMLELQLLESRYKSKYGRFL